MAPRATAVVIVGLLAALPASASAASLQLRIGGFQPRADSNLFRDDAELYGIAGRPCSDDLAVPCIRNRDWRGVTGGAEFTFDPADHVELGLHLDGYGRTLDTANRRFERPDHSDIRQSLKLNVIPLGATLRLVAADRYATVVPYIGVGPDVFFYKYEEFGDFVDPETLDIVADDFVSEGVAAGFHATAGLRFRVNHDFSVLGEARYQWAKTNLGDDFPQQPGEDALRLDMSGLSVVVGLSLRF
jgi:outer membrane protein with beta-barrel domain